MGQRIEAVLGGKVGNRLFVLVLAFFTLAACATGIDYSNEPGYIAGYGDGCATAGEAEKSFSTKRVRDEEAFENDEAYQAGWRAGFLQCDYRVDDKTSEGGLILGEDQNF